MANLGLSEEQLRSVAAKALADVALEMQPQFHERTGDVYRDVMDWIGFSQRHLLEVLVRVVAQNNARIAEDVQRSSRS
jgi:chemotaxis regulatin CheY-phosphate phosphatase CheZ